MRWHKNQKVLRRGNKIFPRQQTSTPGVYRVYTLEKNMEYLISLEVIYSCLCSLFIGIENNEKKTDTIAFYDILDKKMIFSFYNTYDVPLRIGILFKKNFDKSCCFEIKSFSIFKKTENLDTSKFTKIVKNEINEYDKGDKNDNKDSNYVSSKELYTLTNQEEIRLESINHIQNSGSNNINKEMVLLIMNPRVIPEVIKSFKSIRLPKVWFRGYNLKEVTYAMNHYISISNFRYYIVVSDDVIVTSDAVDKVCYYLKKYDVFTGYCNLHLETDEVNLCKEPLTLKNNKYPVLSDYKWFTQKEVDKEDDVFETFIIANSLTGMKKDLWLKFPTGVYFNPKGKYPHCYCSSDHNLSYRLSSAGIKMYTHRECFVKHLKKNQNKTMLDGWLVGKVNPQVIEDFNLSNPITNDLCMNREIELNYPNIQKINAKELIVFLDYVDYANVLTEWSHALTKSSDLFEGMVVCFKPHIFKYRLKHHFDINKLDKNEKNILANRILGSKIIVIGDACSRHLNSWNAQNVFIEIMKKWLNFFPINSNSLEGKKILMFHPGSDYRSGFKIINKKTGFFKTIFAPDLFRLGEGQREVIWPLKSFPNLFQVEEIIISRFKSSKLIILHCPSVKAKKGSKIISRVVKETIIKFPKFKYIEISNKPNELVMDYKKIAVIYIDQYDLNIGSFGVSSIESLVLGNIVFSSINNIDEDTIECAMQIPGVGLNDKKLPILPTGNSEQIFKQNLDRVCQLDNDKLLEISLNNYRWASKYLTESYVAKRFERILE